MNDNFSVGDVMSEGRNKALKTLAVLAGLLVYLGMIGYSAVHNWQLLTAGVPDDMVVVAAIGVIALEVSAVALPIALHWWCYDPMQRILAFGFYALDLAMIFINVVLDYSLNTGGELPGWLQMYLFYGVPATPVFAGLGWTLLFLTDPSQHVRGTIATLQASTVVALAKRVAERAKAAEVSEDVDERAAQLVDEVVNATLGLPAKSRRPALPARTVEGTARDVEEKKPGLVDNLKAVVNGRRPAPRQEQISKADAGANPTLPPAEE